jgi:hypothetical protein
VTEDKTLSSAMVEYVGYESVHFESQFEVNAKDCAQHLHSCVLVSL